MNFNSILHIRNLIITQNIVHYINNEVIGLPLNVQSCHFILSLILPTECCFVDEGADKLISVG
jgi:hypothetical protein